MQNFNNNDINECSSRGACSVSPIISALETLSITFLQHISYYLLKLEDFGVKNQKIKSEIIGVLASFISINEFNNEQLYSIIQDEYYMLQETRKTYIGFCKNNDIKTKLLRQNLNILPNTTIAEAIVVGEKLFLDNLKNNNHEVKNLKEILFSVIKSLAINLSFIQSFNFDDDIYYIEILSALSLLNTKNLKKSEILMCIDKLANKDNELLFKLYEVMSKEFGIVHKVSVSHSSRPGKAILVSGDSLSDLLLVLKAIKGKNIDVYTHSNLLVAHLFAEFGKYPQLIGHYGNSTENCIVDFATFPGAILLTKNSRTYNEYFYRGRLFTTNNIVPKGVIKIDQSNFEPLVESALFAKGFTKGKIKRDTVLGYEENEIDVLFADIADKFLNNMIKRLYIVGLDPHSESQNAYFSEFFEKLSSDEFVISFSYSSLRENVYSINIANCIPLFTYLVDKLFKIIPISGENIYLILTTCDIMSLSSLIAAKNKGARNILLAKCPPTIINPSVVQTLSDCYNVKLIGKNPEEDLNNLRNKKHPE